MLKRKKHILDLKNLDETQIALIELLKEGSELEPIKDPEGDLLVIYMFCQVFDMAREYIKLKKELDSQALKPK